jgi:phage terminase large subunit-like protein
MSKRMNLPESSKESAVADWDSIAATNQEIPDLRGWSCSVGVDYSKTTDWMSVNLHFKDGDQRYDINKAWMCSASRDIPRIKAPWREWIKTDHLEYVDDVEIHPSVVANYIQEMGKIYNINMVAIDSYRYSLLSDALSKVGFSKDHKNLMLVKQADIIKVVPVIDHCFLNRYFHWGNNPVLRWATNNTKTIRYGKNEGADKGSFVYAKIEGQSRKTDPFMALVASMVAESSVKERPKIPKVNVITF